MKRFSAPILVSILASFALFFLFQNCGPNDPNAHDALHSSSEDDDDLNDFDDEEEDFTVTAFYPGTARLAGNAKLTVIGSGFLATDKILVKNKACTNVTLVTSKELSCTLPAVTAAGTAVIKVRREDNSETVQINGFQYTETTTPVTLACSPNSPSKVTLSQSIRFPSSTTACAWGKNGNLAASDGGIKARRSQLVRITIPSGAILCADSSLEFRRNNFVFGDAFFFLLNGRVLASSHGFINNLTRSGGYYVYSWENVLLSQQSGLYCPAGVCSLEGDSDEPRSIHFSPNIAFLRSAMGAGKNGVNNFYLVMMGDNDPTDCRHNGVVGSLDITYDFAR